MCPILESLFVGFYTSVVYLLVKQMANIISPSFGSDKSDESNQIDFFIILAITGFLKHYLGHYLGLHKFYCKYGSACQNVNVLANESNPLKYLVSKNNDLITDSVFESIMFVVLGYFFNQYVDNKIILFFIFGMSLHLISEYIGIHQLFCARKCD